MNRNYNLKLDLQFRCNNSTMKFNQFDNNTSDFFMRITNGGKLVDIEKAIVVLAIIKPSGKVSSQFVEVENDLVYADLKPNMKDEIGTYTAKAMLILEDERVVTDVISYEVEEDKIFSLLNDTVETTEEFTLLTDMLSRLSNIETNEEQRMINEAERILSEENRKIEEAKRVEAELIRQHEEADRAKYDATRESNENIRKINEETRISSENVRLENEANRIEQEANRVKAEQLRKDNYNFMTEDEERRRSEANAHKEAEALRVQAETNRVNEEAKRRTLEQARVSAENTRVSNENTRKANETTRQTNETHRVEAETQRQNRYNSFIADAEANASNFENYTNTAKVKEEERKANELDRKSQENKRKSNEVDRISNENTRQSNESTRQNVFENKVNEVDKKISEINSTKDNFISSINTKVDTKISELNTTKDNFVSSVNTKVDNKISELDNAKSDMTNIVSNKVNEVETRFNALTSSQQQDAEVIDARVDFEGVAFNSLKERIDYTDKLLRDSTVSTVTTESDFTTVEATNNGYFEDVKLEGKTLVVNLDNEVVEPGIDGAMLKSVGEDVDEIVVSSVKGDGNLLMPLYTGATTNGYNKNNITFSSDYSMSYIANGWGQGVSVDVICVVKGETYVILCDTNTNMCIKGTNALNTTSDIQIHSNKAEIVATATGIGTIEFKNATETGNISCTNLRVIKKGSKEEFSVLNQDKKRLLYYNEETQVWEKPILREWDSIEKHANGKYYYHQRSGEVVLNGSENWNNDKNSSTISPATYRQSIQFDTIDIPNAAFNTKTSPNIISDLLPTVIFGDVYSYNHIGISISGTDSIGTHIIINNNFIDVTELKQWLQANNLTLVYQLAQEKVYECTNIDLITYNGETNYVVNSGAIVPKTTLKVHSNISNVVSLLQKKVSLLESNIKASQEVQDMMILETDMRMLDIELALMEFAPMKLNLGGSDMLRSATYFNFLKNHIINETYEKEYLENVMNKYLATGRINQDEYNELYKMLYPPVYDIELPIEY